MALVIVIGCEPVTVMVSGWEETLLLEPLKLSAVAEKVSLLALFELAQTGLAARIAARGRTIFFTTNYSGVRE